MHFCEMYKLYNALVCTIVGDSVTGARPRGPWPGGPGRGKRAPFFKNISYMGYQNDVQTAVLFYSSQ